jgi:hypothetical protein
MTERQNDTEKKGHDFCTDMRIAGIMRKMMDNQETICCCPELMSRMMSRYCMVKDEKEEAPKT